MKLKEGWDKHIAEVYVFFFFSATFHIKIYLSAMMQIYAFV